MTSAIIQARSALTGESGLVSASGCKGPGGENATGVAVFLPFTAGNDIAKRVDVTYDRLDLARDTRGGELLAAHRRT